MNKCASAVVMLSWLGAKDCFLGGNVSLGEPFASGGSNSAGANSGGGKATSSTGGSGAGGNTEASGGSTGGAEATGGSTGGTKATGGTTGGTKATGGSTGGTKATGGTTGGTKATGGTTATGGAASNPVGEFRAELVAANAEFGSPAYTSFSGGVFDGPMVNTFQLELDSEQDGCRLMVPKMPVCSPSCGNAAVCTDENVCTPYPARQDVGRVHVTGLGPSEFVMDPIGSGYQLNSTLPYPPCSEGSTVSVQADTFRIQGKCIAPFTLLGADPVPVMAGKGVPLSWTPPGQAGITQIHVLLDISHHAGLKGEIECDVADTGSFEIPEPLVTKLVSLGLAGFPTIVVGRVSTAYSATPKAVRLVVSSKIERAVDSGVRSCTGEDDCLLGQTCRADLICN